MTDNFIVRIKAYLTAQAASFEYPPTTELDLGDAERVVKFGFPPLLRACLLEIGNGGFGPASGLIGVKGGCTSDLGDLVETYQANSEGKKWMKEQWPEGLLPFCYWGGLTFSCVDCLDPANGIAISDHLDLTSTSITLEEFFERWMSGGDAFGRPPRAPRKFMNPFTRQLEDLP